MDVSERLTLGEATDATLLGASHVHRYELAARLCAGLRVADVCCGVGYGSSILGRVCPWVIGVDVDETAIDEARRTFGGQEGLTFEVADAVEFLAAATPASLEAVVVFEGLEHLSRVEDALRELRRLASGGVALVLSVPNVRAQIGDNPFHLAAFDLERVRSFADGLPGGTILYQHIAEGSLIRGDRLGALECEVVFEERAEAEYAYGFVVCANLPDVDALPTTARSTLALAPLNHRYINGLEHANEQLAQANRRLARERLGVAESAAASLLARLDVANEEIERLKHELGIAGTETEEERASREQAEWTASLVAEIDRHKVIVEELSLELEAIRAERTVSPSLVARVAGRLRGRRP